MDLAAAVPASLAPPGRCELGTAAFGDTREVRPSDPNQSANLQQLQSYLARFGHSKLPVQPASPAEATAARKRSFDDMLQEKMGQFWEHRERQTQAQATRSPFLPSRPTDAAVLSAFRQGARSGSDFVGHDFGMARIKRLMREDSCDDPLMIGMNAPHVAAYGATKRP